MKKILTLITLLMFGFANIYAQKLPKVQTTSVRAPNNIKIDGKLDEWSDQFQAYNWGFHIYYTVSNDEENLYLTARMDDILGTRKIFKGGLNFSVIPVRKSAEKISIVFPIVTRRGLLEQVEGGPIFRYSIMKPAEQADKRKVDSLVARSNEEIIKAYKQLYVTGIPDVDTLTSIYNTHNIRVGASFDEKMRYTYELAIPLKHLKAGITNNSLKYNIKFDVMSPIKIVRPVSVGPILILEPVKAQGPTNISLEDQFTYGIIDFSGEYILAK